MKNPLGLRVMPLVWLAFSIAYIIFSLSIDPRKMPADREGWDPGSNAMPLGVGYVMAAMSGYLVITDRKRPQADTSETDVPHAADDGRDVKRLVLATIIIALIYITTFRFLGFVITSTFLVMSLTYLYIKQHVSFSDIGEYLGFLVVSLLANAILYSFGRWLMRWMQYYGRTLEIAPLQNRMVVGLIALAAWSLLIAPVYLLIRRTGSWKQSAGSRAALTASLTTLGFYLVFQQVFRVALPPGLLAW